MDARLRFVQDVSRGVCSFTELCGRYGISRTTAYETLGKYAQGGPASLADGSHWPHTCPHATPAALVREILELQQRYTWGARKVRVLLKRRGPTRSLPSIATVHRILVQYGRVRPRRRSRRRAHPGRPMAPMDQPNAVWSADFKGQFRMGNGAYCYPLTVQDGASRYLLGCQACWNRPSGGVDRCSRGCFGATGFPTASVPTMAPPSRRAPWAGSRPSRCGGCDSGSCRT